MQKSAKKEPFMRRRFIALSAFATFLTLGSLATAESPRRSVDADAGVALVGPRARVETTAAAPRTAASHYSPLAVEAYLTEEQLGYIRPGVKVAILGITNVAPGKKPVVEF